MLKNIVLVLIIGALGYAGAMVFPPPDSWQSQVTAWVDASKNQVSNEMANLPTDSTLASENDQTGEDKADSEQADTMTDSDNASDADVFIQQDLLFSPLKDSETATLILGTFADADMAEQAIAAIAMQDEAEQHPFQLPTGTQVVLVTIGQFESITLATKRKLDLEAFQDLNLQLAKYPEKTPPPKDENAQLAESLIEVLQGLPTQ